MKNCLQKKTLKYKLYRNRKNRRLHNDLELASEIYNHALSLQKRYYRLYKKHLKLYAVQKHITKLKRLAKHAHWKKLNSQVIQEIAERIDKGYLLFFKGLKNKQKISPPRFRKKAKYSSITFKQTGFKYLKENKIKIGKHCYKFFHSRPLEGKIKTMTLKKDALGDFYLFFSVEVKEDKKKATSGEIVGFDFGLQKFLTATDFRAPYSATPRHIYK